VKTATTADFVRAHTRLLPAPFVPEVRLHLADEAIPLWERTEQERGDQQPPPFWAFAWAGGQALARYILDHPDIVRGRTVFDLAAGSGLVAIAAARAGAAAVTANEIDEYAVAAIEINTAANGATVTTILGDVLDGPTPGAADVVLAGDVFYSRPMADRVLPFLRRAGTGGARVLVGDPGRAYLPHDAFRAVATYPVPVPFDLESTEIKSTTVWTLPRTAPI
jgi:predicted nicotinamide N-methyase